MNKNEKFTIYKDKIFYNPIKIIKAFNNTEFLKAFSEIEKLKKSFYIIGYIRYEAKDIFLKREISSQEPLLYFEVFDNYKKLQLEPNVNTVVLNKKPDIEYAEYSKDIESIKKEISYGNTYEVNYTYDYTVTTNSNELDLYKELLKKQKTPYNTYIKNEYETILSFSPELFFELKNNHIITKPMKGTIKRGETIEQDKKNIEFLKTDIKNKAENIMIVDLLRNDLGKIAQTGTVKVDKLFEIETHPTLHQMTSQISADLKNNTSLYDVFEAIFPCGSITGAPKISTMEIIDKVEKGKRNVYCGAIGFLEPDNITFSVPIRILQKKNNENSYKYRVGGAIVWDSDIKDEWDETITKSKFLDTNHSNFSILETAKIENGKILYFLEHIKRMQNTANFFNYPFNENKIKPDIKNISNGIIRILLDYNGKIHTEIKNLKEINNNKVRIAKNTTYSQNIFLYHKTTYRNHYKNSSDAIKNNEVFDEIYFNEKGELTEGSRTNLLLQIDNKLFTPKLESGVLNGIMRQKLLNEKKCTEKILYKNDLFNAEKIYCINSVRGIIEVELV